LTEFVKPTKTYAKSLYLSEVNHIDHKTGGLKSLVFNKSFQTTCFLNCLGRSKRP